MHDKDTKRSEAEAAPQLKAHKVFDEHNVEGPQESDEFRYRDTQITLKAVIAASFTPEIPSEGERRVRLTFNSGNDEITNIKQHFASLIDSIHYTILPNPNWNAVTMNEFHRNKAVTISAIEKAAMYAVKAATTQNS